MCHKSPLSGNLLRLHCALHTLDEVYTIIMGSGGEEKSKKSARKAQLKEEAERLGITCEIDIPRPVSPLALASNDSI